MKEQEMKKPKKESKKPMTDECTHQDEMKQTLDQEIVLTILNQVE